ncbi:hypothetical protein AJ88_28345 [Mesorhizobium amorphae CCBAU 01583]|nr:hypothetical protein AJ88_28345 [Mesorhizobium amorphae CCBAU 01583]
MDPPSVAYLYAPNRKAEQPIRHLQGFVGTLQVDGYAGYKALAERNAVSLAFCWSTYVAASMNSRSPAPRRSRRRRSPASPNSTDRKRDRRSLCR